jgi:acetolactate synthase small subunit
VEPRGSRRDLDLRVVEQLRVETTKLVDVPRVADVVTFECLETIGTRSGHFGD